MPRPLSKPPKAEVIGVVEPTLSEGIPCIKCKPKRGLYFVEAESEEELYWCRGCGTLYQVIGDECCHCGYPQILEVGKAKITSRRTRILYRV